jgi:drug/metabolite transporter (DMT)-like permease
MNSNHRYSASTLSIWAGMLTIYVIWGSTYLAIRFAVETIPPFLMAGVRFLIAGVILYGWRRLRGDPRPTLRQWGSAAIVGLLLLLGGNGGVSWAEQYVPSGITSLLIATVPLWVVVVDWVFARHTAGWRRPAWITLVGIIIGLAGVVVLIGPSQLTGIQGNDYTFGAVAIVVAALLWATGSVYSRSADLPDSPLLGTGMEMLCGGVGLVLTGTIAGEWSRFQPAAFSLRSIGGITYLIVFGSLVAFAAYTWLLRAAPTTTVATYAYVNPVVAIFLGNILAAETITPRVMVAAAIILGAVVLITLTQPASRKSEPEVPPVVPAQSG